MTCHFSGRHVTCILSETQILLENKSYLKSMTRDSSPKGRPQMPNTLQFGAIFSCIPISRLSIPPSFASPLSSYPPLHTLPFPLHSPSLLLLSPISPCPSPSPRRWIRNLAMADSTRSASRRWATEMLPLKKGGVLHIVLSCPPPPPPYGGYASCLRTCFFICNVLCITKERPIRSTLSSLADEATTTLNLHALCWTRYVL